MKLSILVILLFAQLEIEFKYLFTFYLERNQFATSVCPYIFSYKFRCFIHTKMVLENSKIDTFSLEIYYRVDFFCKVRGMDEDYTKKWYTGKKYF